MKKINLHLPNCPNCEGRKKFNLNTIIPHWTTNRIYRWWNKLCISSGQGFSVVCQIRLFITFPPSRAFELSDKSGLPQPCHQRPNLMKWLSDTDEVIPLKQEVIPLCQGGGQRNHSQRSGFRITTVTTVPIKKPDSEPHLFSKPRSQSFKASLCYWISECFWGVFVRSTLKKQHSEATESLPQPNHKVSLEICKRQGTRDSHLSMPISFMKPFVTLATSRPRQGGMQNQQRNMLNFAIGHVTISQSEWSTGSSEAQSREAQFFLVYIMLKGLNPRLMRYPLWNRSDQHTILMPVSPQAASMHKRRERLIFLNHPHRS